MFILKYLDGLLASVDEWTSSWLIPSLARLAFAGVLLIYFWNSAATKLGDGLFGFLSPSLGAYAQIFPKSMEAVGYDPSQLSFVHTLIVIAGTWGEFILPLLILIGLLTRLAALGMIGFVVIQSIVDVFGHGVSGSDLGSWFDAASDSVVVDQRTFWILLFVILAVKGAGPISVDRFLFPAESDNK